SFNSYAGINAFANQDEKVKIEPELTVADNKLKPKISFNSRQNLGSKDTFSVAFDFSANSGIDVGRFDDPITSSEDIISQYVADGGNMEFNLSFSYKNGDFFVGIGPYYSLLTTDALSTEENSSSIISVDAEIYGLNIMTMYKFNKSIGVYLQYSTYDTTGEGKNADFSKILDDGNAVRLGVEIPTSSDPNAYVLRFERTKHSEVDKAIFRVSISKPFNFF
ncbi:hypothetical protein JAO78_016035, partial [Alishewanella sp. 16-MA]